MGRIEIDTPDYKKEEEKREAAANIIFTVVFSVGTILGGYAIYKKNLINKKVDNNYVQIAKSESLGSLKDYGFSLSSVQLFFALEGIYNLDNDGIYGEETFKAIKAYQSKKGISVDGSIGDETAMNLILEGFCDNISCHKINKNMSELIYEFKKIGIEVEGLQKVLKDEGYYDGKIDGLFGINTYKAIIKVIFAKGLETSPLKDPYFVANEIKKVLGIIDQ